MDRTLLMQLAAYAHVELFAANAEKPEAPKEFRIFRRGLNASTKGTMMFSRASAKAVMARQAAYGNTLPVDYQHAMFTAKPGEDHKAAGWFVPDVRDGELWATQVEWTPAAKAAIENKEWRFISPAFAHNKALEVLELYNVALTNMPALHNATPLLASFTNGDALMLKHLIALLSLAETTTEEQAVDAIKQLKLRADQAPQGAETQGALLQAMLSLTGTKEQSNAVAKVIAWKEQANTLAAEVTTLSAQISAMKAEQAKAEIGALIEGGVKAGKILPAQRAMFTKLAEQDLESVKAILAAAPVNMPKGAALPPEAGTTDKGLTASEIAIAKMLSISPEALAKDIALHGRFIREGAVNSADAK